jgi:N-acetylglucosamine-6-phosphate deacetylase
MIKDGVITAVAPAGEMELPSTVTIIDVRGKHLAPGIIDCHSHMASDGGINESGQAITAEVRIGDFIDPDDINIYRQLAGGVTAANVLHGSANPIGGQSQVIKLRWGTTAEELKMAEAPPGIKFALGENVKQSNWGDKFTTRYPQTRQGVEQIILDEFHAARDYERRHEAWHRTHEGMPPRRDLQLEAIAEVLAGKRWIHCHSYRQDEILMLLRLMERFGVTVGTLQHVLEGYKLAPEIARHGAMGSTFSDWWAYKFEVFDAIPFNGALMHEAGVVVSFNSDNQELARHLNHEAAKAVKYGGVPEHEALRLVTLNPARQLRIDQFVGSLEAGKHADLVVWSGPPLSTLSRCEQTWIDGRKYFDLESDAKARDEARALHATLVQEAIASGEEMADGDEPPDLSEMYPREDSYCGHGHGHAY